MERKGLGRGLSALLADVSPADDQSEPAGRTNLTTSVPVEHLYRNPNQPRQSFSIEDLDELASSVREKGIIQPLIVRPHPEHSGGYEIVAGERRWRAAQRAQLHEVPVLIRTLTDGEVLELAIVENIQRSNLNPLEEAQGCRQLMDRFGHTQERLAEILGKSRSYIANLLRLLTLPEPVLSLVREGELSAGHARALVTSPDAIKLAQQVVERGLSVRETEALTRRTDAPKKSKPSEPSAKDPDTRALEEDLAASVGLPVIVKHYVGTQRGEIRIRYSSLDELDILCQRLSR